MYFYQQDNIVSNFMKRVNFSGILFKCGFETLIVFFKHDAFSGHFFPDYNSSLNASCKSK